MIECRLILPTSDNDGVTLQDVHRALQSDLIAAFGGYTKTRGMGGWQCGDLTVEEEVFVYDVAIQQANTINLKGIAVAYGKKAKQDAVYLRIGTTVEIITE